MYASTIKIRPVNVSSCSRIKGKKVGISSLNIASCLYVVIIGPNSQCRDAKMTSRNL